MAEIESISHSGIEGPDSMAVHDFYTNILGGTPVQAASGAYEGPRGGSAHPCEVIGDYLFVVFPDRAGRELPPTDQLRGGTDGDPRHAFQVSRERFDAVMEWLRENDVRFEGPVTHPERGPLGQSIYFTDRGHNWFEVCWRRDTAVKWAPVPVSQG